MTIPGASDSSDNDSNIVSEVNKGSLYRTLKDENVLTLRRSKAAYFLEQQSNYKLEITDRQTIDHYISFPGTFYKKNFPWSFADLGIEWVPKLNYKIRSTEKTFQSTVDLGPILSSELFSLPIKVRTGLSADVWKEHITGNAIDAVLKENSSDPGFYGACEIGDETRPVNNIPLYLSLKASGRSVRNAGLGLWMGSALWANDLGTGDSLYFFVSDSLSNGKESFLDQGTTFSTTPWRIIHGFSGSAGLKMAERLGFSPAAYYRYSLHSVNYPSDTMQINDVRTFEQRANLLLSSFGNFFFNYSGGIECAWSNQDWVYKSKNGDIVFQKVIKRLEANNNDNREFTIRMDHDLSIPLPAGFEFGYLFSIARESYMYDNYYMLSGASVRNQMERDNVEKSHHFSIFRSDSSVISAGLQYDFNRGALHYLREQRSGSSRNRETQRIELDFGLKLNRLEISEVISVTGEKNEYIFKKEHKDPFDPPTQQRNLNSRLSGGWAFNEYIKLVCEWNEQYRDDGYWYGNEYLPDTVRNNYYAIENKTNDYSIVMHADITWNIVTIVAGGSFRDIYSLGYSTADMKYVSSRIGEGYWYEPYLQLKITGEGIVLSGRVKRTFNTVDPDRWSKYKNWDAAFYLQKEW